MRTNLIPSRQQVTNQAILSAIGEGQGRKLLDLGCGEGWLSRACAEQNWICTGVDAVASLVSAALELSDQEYLTCLYGEITQALADRKFDLVVANFSLLGEESTEEALEAVNELLEPEACLLIQTVHPHVMPGPYESAWRTEDWKSLGELSCSQSPWYFRTLEAWFDIFRRHKLQTRSVLEPRAKPGDKPSSVIFRLASMI